MNSVRHLINLIHFSFVFLSSLAALLLLTIFAAPQAARAATTCATSGNDVTISADCNFDAGTYTFTGTLTIGSGVTVTATGDTSTNAGVTLSSDNITVTGTLTAIGKGYTAENGTGKGTNLYGYASGAGYGGNGGNELYWGGNILGGVTYGSVKQPADLGSGGGGSGSSPGGSGGGAIKLNARGTLTINGAVSANGGDSNFAGGGSGGSVWLDADTLAGTGSVTANGGAGGSSLGGAGGGGRVAIYFGTNSSSLTKSAKGGLARGSDCGNNYCGTGGAGTVYEKSGLASNGDLTVDNANTSLINVYSVTTQVTTSSQIYDNITIKNGSKYVLPASHTLTAASGGSVTGGGTKQPSVLVNSNAIFNLPSGTVTVSNLDVTNNGTVGVAQNLTFSSAKFVHDTAVAAFGAGNLSSLTLGSGGVFSTVGTNTLTIGTVTVNSGGILTHEANTTTQANKLSISSTTFTVNSGGGVDVSAKGFGSEQGTGHGQNGNGYGGGGGGYGGAGGDGGSVFGSVSGGVPYGSDTQPSDIGSGGGNLGASPGGLGGGAVKLVALGTMTVDGAIKANGSNAHAAGVGGGGSGGSVWLDAGTFAGTGFVTANGGNGAGSEPAYAGGCGGGGRMAFYANTFSHSGTRTASGTCTSGTRHGDAGTTVQQQTQIGDTIAPTVGAVAPTTTGVNMATTFSAIYSDNTGVNSCNFFADNIDQGIMTLSAPGGTIGIATTLHTYTSIGAHTAQVKCKDAANNEGADTLTTVNVVDITPPDTIIDTSPPSISTSADAIFTFHATESPATFECQLDGGGLASCVSPKSYIGLAGGNHTFNVRATDEAGNIDPTPASFTWIINRPPVANPDFYTTNEDTTLTVPALTGVLVNDTDIDGNALTAVLGASPSNGTLTFNSNGSFAYTPNANFFGTDTLTYQAKDTAGELSNLALVTITINDVPEHVVVNGGVLVSSVINADGSLMVTVTGTGQGRNYTTILPAGAAPLSPNTAIILTVIDTNAKRAKFKVETTLPAGVSKTMTVPRSTGKRACVQDVSEGTFNIGGDCPSANRVTIPLAGSSCTSPALACSNLPLGVTISTSVDNMQVTVSGLKHSVVEIVGDTDGDGVDDDEDQCPNDVGSAATSGCPSAIRVLFQRHTVQSGIHPGSAKTPIVGATVNIYSKIAGSCAATIGINPKNYKTIYEGNLLNGSNDLDGPCLPDQSSVTDLTGSVTIGVLLGDYIAISKDPVTNVFAGVSVGTVISGQVVEKFIQVIVRADGSAVSAKTTQNNGSVLYTIEPEYIDWTGTAQLYPYVFDSEGAWDVTVNVTPPYGFIADYSSLATIVNSEYRALQFTLTNTGSCWECGLDVEVTVKHEGKTKKWRSNVRSDISEEYAKKKGLDPHELEKKGVVVTGKGSGGAKGKDKN